MAGPVASSSLWAGKTRDLVGRNAHLKRICAIYDLSSRVERIATGSEGTILLLQYVKLSALR